MSAFDKESVLVQLSGKVLGPFPVKQLRRLKGFTVQSLISFPGSEKWAPAYRVLNMNSYEPPEAYASPTFEPIMEWTTVPSTPAFFDWKATHFSGGWVDRWFRRLAIFNSLLAIAAYGASFYPPIRIPVERELRRIISEQEIPGRLVMVRLIYSRPEKSALPRRPLTA